MTIVLEHALTYRLEIHGPLASTAGAPLGETQYWEMRAGHLTGSGISAHTAMPGGDWMRIGTDGLWRPNVRSQLVTEDEAVILLHYVGLAKPNPTFEAAAANGTSTEFDDQYLRQFMQFETGAAKYAWLTQELFLAEGRLTGQNELEYRVG